MTVLEKREMARRLRTQAEEIHRHGLTNFFEHTFTCARYGQASKSRVEDRCLCCPLRPVVPSSYEDEAFPCQHINEQGWNLVRARPELTSEHVTWLRWTAEQLEAEATGRPT